MRTWLNGIVQELTTSRMLKWSSAIKNYWLKPKKILDSVTTDTIVLDGLDDAIVGVHKEEGKPDALIYSESLIVELLVKQSDMNYDEAIEYLRFNITNAYFGEGNPVFED